MAAYSKNARLLALQTFSASALLLYRLCKRNKRKRSIWVREVLQERAKYGFFTNLIPNVRQASNERRDPLFMEMFRLSPLIFDYLLHLVEPLLKKKDTQFRDTISPAERLSITLSYLATGDQYRSISLAYRVGKSTLSRLIPEACEAIWTVLQPIYLKAPSQEEMKHTAEQFSHYWNFPNCCGAIDGKHVTLIAPPNAGSMFYNYKGSHSIVLMAACDAQYRFTHVDIGNYGKIGDSGIFSSSAFGRAILSDGYCPPPKNVPDHVVLPHVFVADDAFPLKRNLLKPYPGRQLSQNKQRIFNYRLSMARRCIENAFGIASARWRVLRKPILLLPEHAAFVVKAVVCLHNLLMSKDAEMHNKNYCPHGFGDFVDCGDNVHDGDWRQNGLGTGLQEMHHQGSNRHGMTAAAVRDSFAEYFASAGAVAWQNRVL